MLSLVNPYVSLRSNCDAVTHSYDKKIVTIGSSSNANIVQLRRVILCD